MFELFKMLFFNATLYDFTKSLIYYSRFPLTLLTSAQMIHENDAVVIIGALHITYADISLKHQSLSTAPSFQRGRRSLSALVLDHVDSHLHSPTHVDSQFKFEHLKRTANSVIRGRRRAHL